MGFSSKQKSRRTVSPVAAFPANFKSQDLITKSFEKILAEQVLHRDYDRILFFEVEPFRQSS